MAVAARDTDPERLDMQPYLNRRTKAAGMFVRFDQWDDYGTNRQYPTARLDDLEIDGKVVAPHIWLHRAQALVAMDPARGNRIEFDGVVTRYSRKVRELGVERELISFGMDHPLNFVIPDRNGIALQPPPALPPIRAAVPVLPARLPAKPVAAPGDAFALLAEVKALAKKCGGYATLRNMISILED